jgi:vancomycin permeability regulator SanA
LNFDGGLKHASPFDHPRALSFRHRNAVPAAMNRKTVKRYLLISGAAFLLVFLICAALIVFDGLRDDLQVADVAIVPGNKIEADGRPSARLRARLDKTVELYARKLFTQVIVSGGVGQEGFDEAMVMKNYLIEKGLPAERIHVDSQGATTYLTARNASRMMKENGWQSALVVSQYFHISRMKLALRRHGILRLYSAHAEFFELRDIYSIIREVFGYGSYLIRAYD